jgi:hypothetical protein
MIRAQIDTDGAFYITNVRNVLTAKVCPYNRLTHFCGEWCPHFKVIRGTESTQPQICFCHGTILTADKLDIEGIKP